jgi:DNA-binding NtrC family response regulator
MTHGPISSNESSLRSSIPICMVDDHESLLKVSTLLLQDAGFTVLGTRYPEVAFRGIQAVSFRVVLVDVVMPGIDGFTFLDRALQIDPSLKVILITGFYSDAEAKIAIERGASEYLPKPLDWPRVFSILDRIASAEAKKAEADDS